jgi:hypothetical protein
MFKTKFPTMFLEADKGAGGGEEHKTPADDLEDKTGGDPGTTPEGGAGEGKPEGGADKPGEGGEKTFTQEELNAILQKRLAEEKQRQDKRKQEEAEEAERKRLEEQQEYQKLAEKYKEELDVIKAEATETKKVAALVKAGYSEEQVERYKKFVDGETDEEIADAVKVLVEDVPPKAQKTYADPALGNGGKGKPPAKDKESKGREAFQRLKKAGKIR